MPGRRPLPAWLVDRLVAVEAVEMCDNKAPVFEMFSATSLICSTIIAMLVLLVAVAKLVLPPNTFWEEAS